MAAARRFASALAPSPRSWCALLWPFGRPRWAGTSRGAGEGVSFMPHLLPPARRPPAQHPAVRRPPARRPALPRPVFRRVAECRHPMAMSRAAAPLRRGMARPPRRPDRSARAVAALGIAHVDEDGALDALPPQRAPEAFDLAERLRVAWPGHDLLDAAFFQLLGERALAAPSHVLRAVVGEDLLRRAVRRQADAQHLQDQRGRLTGVQAVARDESAVVIHERDEIDAPVLTLEHEREQIGLPELVGRGAFEVTHLVRVRMGRHFLEHVTGLVQDGGDRTGAGWQGGTTQQHVADLLATPVRVGLLEHQDAALGEVRQPAATRRPAWLV